MLFYLFNTKNIKKKKKLIHNSFAIYKLKDYSIILLKKN